MRQTLAIIKPDAVGNGRTGRIIAHLESAGFALRAARMVTMTRAQAQSFYDVHRERPFYDALVAFMTSGPCIPMALEAPDAVRRAAPGHRRHGSRRGGPGHGPGALRRVEGAQCDTRLRLRRECAP